MTDWESRLRGSGFKVLSEADESRNETVPENVRALLMRCPGCKVERVVFVDGEPSGRCPECFRSGVEYEEGEFVEGDD